MKIGFFTTGFDPVKEDTVKATEHFVYDLASLLSRRGNQIYLFGAHGSKGNFHVVNPKASGKTLSSLNNLHEYDCYVAQNFLDFVDFCHLKKIDLLHEHTNEIPTTLARYARIPVVSTLHGSREPGNLSTFYAKSDFMFRIAPSKSVIKASPDLRFYKTIYHGIDIDKYNFCDKPDDSFICLGRIVADKGPIDAIEAARISGEKLQCAGYPMDENDDYYKNFISKISFSQKVKYIGKVSRKDIPFFMSKGKALLMPTKIEEAFGLVMVEAMAVGTPVITYDRGTAREIVEDGVTGFIVKKDDIKAMAEAMKRIGTIDRKACRARVEKLFSIEKMVDQYEEAYREALKDYRIK